MKAIKTTKDKVIVKKPWGQEEIWALNEHYCGKILTVKPGHSLSLQYHQRKVETLYVQTGVGTIRIGEKEVGVSAGTIIHVPAGTVHRITATTILVLLEVSTPEIDDVVRLEDKYGRVQG